MSSGEAYDNKGLDHTILKVEIKSNSGKGSSLSSNCEFIFVMDISGSMGVYVNEILTKVFPKVYDKLNFPENKIIHLLTFKIVSSIIHIIKMILKIVQYMIVEVLV
jgi:hypothetical protein